MFRIGDFGRRRVVTVGLIVLVVVLAATAVGLILALLRGTAHLAVASPTTAPSASFAAPSPPAASVGVTAYPSAVGTPEPTADESTPQPTPAPVPTDPAILPAGSWVRTNVELNMRREPGLTAELLAVLEPGVAVLAVEGPIPADGFDWYRVLRPLGGEADTGGWIARGSQTEPFVDFMSSEQVLRTCGAVQNETTVAGLKFPGALDVLETDILRLLAATEGTACVTLDRSAQVIFIYVDASVIACGEPQWDGGDLWLEPAAGDAGPNLLVKRRVFVGDSVLSTHAILDADGQSNRHRVMRLAAEQSAPFACVHARVTDTPSGTDTFFQTDSKNCFLVEAATPEYALVRAQPNGTLFRLELRPVGGYAQMRIGTWFPLNVAAAAYVGLWQEYLGFWGLSGSCSP